MHKKWELRSWVPVDEILKKRGEMMDQYLNTGTLTPPPDDISDPEHPNNPEKIAKKTKEEKKIEELAKEKLLFLSQNPEELEKLELKLLENLFKVYELLERGFKKGMKEVLALHKSLEANKRIVTAADKKDPNFNSKEKLTEGQIRVIKDFVQSDKKFPADALEIIIRDDYVQDILGAIYKDKKLGMSQGEKFSASEDYLFL
jgi:hypothetical protein